MKSSIYVKRQSFEVRIFSVFLLFQSLFANHKYCVIVFATSLISSLLTKSGNNDPSKSTYWKVLETVLSHLNPFHSFKFKLRNFI